MGWIKVFEDGQSTMIRAGLENKLKEFNKNIKKAAYDNNVEF
jgi:acylphosphatase